MIARTGGLVLAVGLLAGCSGSAASSVNAPGPSPSGSSVTVTATVTPAPAASSPAAGPTVTGPARCDAPALTVSVGDADGAAGTIHRTVVFRNGGEQSCFLRGFPGVSAADAAGKAVVDAARDTSRPAARVVLEPGRAAHSLLAVRNVPPDAKPCPTYPKLLVTAPDSRRTQTLPVEVAPCARQMRISVVLPGEG